jgi:hypothetical protein
MVPRYRERGYFVAERGLGNREGVVRFVGCRRDSWGDADGLKVLEVLDLTGVYCRELSWENLG